MPPPPYSPIGRQSACVALAYRFIVPVGTPHIYGITEAENADIIVGVYTAVAHGGSMNLPDPGSVPAGRRVWFKDESDNAGTYGFSITTAGGSIEGGGGTVDVDGGCVGYYSNGVDKWFQIDAVGAGGGMTIGSPVSGAAANGLLYVDGSGNLGQDAYVNLSASVLTIGGSGAFGGLVIVDTSGNDVFRFETGVAKFGTPNGSTMIGDPFGVGFNSIFEVDDANQKTTSNVKHETSGDITITDHAKGLVLKDAQATPHYWRVQLTAGALTVTDIGTSPP